MPSIDYLTLDVFTTEQFGGNPVAIVPDALGLDSATMQRIATEFNYSETTFVLPPPQGSGCIAEVRIFTPANEIPFAGHPNVGTAWAVASMGALFGQPVGDEFAFQEKAGRVLCQVKRERGLVRATSIAAPKALEIGHEIDASVVASCGSLPEGSIIRSRHSPVMISVGLPFAIAEIDSLESLANATPNGQAFADADNRYRHPDDRFSLFLYVRDGADGHLRARMFAPLSNILEDPATGSASAALGAFLARLDGRTEADFLIDQGVEMGRPSRIEVSVRNSGPDCEVRVGGPCVAMMRGTLSV